MAFLFLKKHKTAYTYSVNECSRLTAIKKISDIENKFISQRLIK